MWLTNLRLPGQKDPLSLHIRDGKIFATTPSASQDPILDFEEALVFPGLINSHDHLDFNLFPALANTRYKNYRDWGWDIHKKNKTEINDILKIPQPLRTLWGIYKNLLNGFTTVVNHGQWLDTKDAPITVHQQCHNLHSIGFERNWRWKLNRPLPAKLANRAAGAAGKTWPFVIHVGEGTDMTAHREITQLIKWNLFRRPLIGIHGVAMTEDQAAHFQALIWCPASNYFLLGQTAPVSKLKSHLPILFGTDSTLTGPWDCWSQIRLARQEGALTDEELFQSLTSNPDAAWGLQKGTLEKGKPADLVIARPRSNTNSWDAFYDLSPEDLLLVMSGGNIVLFDPSLKETLTEAGLIGNNFHQAGPNGKYVPGDIMGLMKEIRSYYPAVQFPDQTSG
ncbi:MAG TPA: amidohydrolase family protein [Puia sp.]|jgi:cytosine/adenosine deaminase-related metal-dependent hydrolase